jgi:hypothetical protein
MFSVLCYQSGSSRLFYYMEELGGILAIGEVKEVVGCVAAWPFQETPEAGWYLPLPEGDEPVSAVTGTISPNCFLEYVGWF